MDYDYPEIARAITSMIEQNIGPLLGTEKAQTLVDTKRGQTNYIDKIAEDTVITYLKDNEIECQLVTEESGLLSEGNLKVILDPLDGTTNALLGIPFYCVSLAFWGEKKYGFVKNLCTKDMYEAFEGGPPLKNGEKISPACTESVASGYIGKGFLKVMPLVDAWRCFGSLALELSYVAEGNLMALVDLRGKARIVDIAGAHIIAEASGVTVTDEKGKSPFAGEFFRNGKFVGKKIICALPDLHERILNALD